MQAFLRSLYTSAITSLVELLVGLGPFADKIALIFVHPLLNLGKIGLHGCTDAPGANTSSWWNIAYGTKRSNRFEDDPPRPPWTEPRPPGWGRVIQFRKGLALM